ncbi:MAG TPA: AAA family ATPase [Lachnospiraceae bacterium]|nr:AAA family ATPase [Lachnospiraceae bacterium]
MNRFYIEKMIISGAGHNNTIINFKPELNFIIGPSNTGKSLLVDCIDYAFGFTPKPEHPSKIVDNNNGYEKIALHLKTGSGTVILERKIGDTKIEVSGSDTNFEHGIYSTSNSAKKNINTIFLQLLGIDEPHKILSSESGNTQSFTWRSILHLFFMRQADISRETSALKAPGSFGKTASPAALLYLLTGQDADNLKKPESPEISKAKRKALTDYIRDKVERSSKRREELEEFLSSNGTKNLQDAIDKIHKEIDAIQKDLDDSSNESQKVMSQLYSQNSKLSECNTVTHNFSVLQRQYQSDIRRLGFIVNGKISVSTLPSKKHCPFCDSEMKASPSPQYIEAASAELSKIKGHLSELEKAQKDIDKQRKSIMDIIDLLSQQKKEIDTLISEQLRPKLLAFTQQLESHMQLMRFYGELEAVQQNEIQYKSELFEKETEDTPENPKYNIFSYYDYDIVHGFEEKLIEVLSASKIGGSTTARLNMTNFDIDIGGLKKAVSMGGGFCGIVNTITAFAMSAYLIEHDCKAPGFFAADSPLTQLSEADHIKQRDTIKQNFVQYLIEHACERQVIIVEQKKRMPFIPQEDSNKGIHIIEFSRNKASGRYGFLNDVYNPEDR